MDENIREEIKRLEKELSDLKKQARRTQLKPYLEYEMFEVVPIGCLGHIAKAKDGNRVYKVYFHGGNYANLYDFARSLFKFSKIEELSKDEAKEVADFCNEIIPIFNRYAVNKYICNFDRQRFDEAYDDILDYLRHKGKTGAVSTWENDRDIKLKEIMELRGELDG